MFPNDNSHNVISLLEYRRLRAQRQKQFAKIHEIGMISHQAKKAEHNSQHVFIKADRFFDRNLERHMEVARKLREDRLKRNSQVLKSYNLKNKK